jgi:hypothetical protein
MPWSSITKPIQPLGMVLCDVQDCNNQQRWNQKHKPTKYPNKPFVGKKLVQDY